MPQRHIKAGLGGRGFKAAASNVEGAWGPGILHPTQVHSVALMQVNMEA